MPGHLHGTHVAGIIAAVTNNNLGIAGTAKNVKLLAVKIGYDDPESTSTYREYEGIYYAAIMGAKIINCSWGSEGTAKSEEEIIQAVTEMGSLVVCAGGNEYSNKKFYPAAYNGAISVAAINEYNKKPDFSNWGDYIDICAPGVNIWSTVPNNFYKYLDGTSMASPIVAAVASIALLTHKTYKPLQISELLKLTADRTIYDVDSTYYIGSGCVDAYNAVNTKNLKSIILNNYTVIDSDNDGIYSKYDTYNINLDLINVLSPVANVKITAKAVDTSALYINLFKDSLFIDSMTTYQTLNIDSAFTFTLNESIPNDYLVKIKLSIYIADEFIKDAYVQLNVNPSYINITHNNISITANSRGNLAYNNYPANSQGIGFKYKNSQNLLFEGSLMIAVGNEKVSDVARSYSSIPLRNFTTTKLIYDTVLAETGLFRAQTIFNDFKSDPSYGLLVRQFIFASNQSNDKDFIILEYNVTNNSYEKMDSLYLGLFFDWDIGNSGANNIAYYDHDYHFSYCKNVYNDTLPLIGVKLLTSQRENYYGISNNGAEDGIFGIYDGFSKYEKWLSLSSGIVNDTTSKTDISTVVSAGPISLKVGQTAKVAFSLFGASNYNDIVANSQLSQAFYSNLDVADTNVLSKQIRVYPNPVLIDNSNLEILIIDSNYYTVSIYDYMGNLITKLFDEQYFENGLYTFPLDSKLYSSGIYVVKIDSNSKLIDSQIFSIIK
jgi:serine protease